MRTHCNLLTAKQVSVNFGIELKTVLEDLINDKIPFIRKANGLFFSSEELAQWIKLR